MGGRFGLVKDFWRFFCVAAEAHGEACEVMMEDVFIGVVGVGRPGPTPRVHSDQQVS